MAFGGPEARSKLMVTEKIDAAVEASCTGSLLVIVNTCRQMPIVFL